MVAIRSRYLLGALGGIMVIAFLAMNLSGPRISAAAVSDSEHEGVVAAILPYATATKKEKIEAVFLFEMKPMVLAERYFIVPKGCITRIVMEGVDIDLSRYRRTWLCDEDKGILFRFQAPGYRNKMQVYVEGRQHAYGLSIIPDYMLLRWPGFYPGLLVAFLTLGGICAWRYRDMKVTVGACMLVFAGLARWPFFFAGDAGGVEAAYLNMGRAVMQGALPYVMLFDTGPPLVYAVYGVLGLLAGDSLAMVRVLGTVLVAAAGFMAYLAVRRFSHGAGWGEGFLYIAVASAAPWGSHVLGDHVVAVPMAAALWLILSARKDMLRAWACGVLGGVCAMTVCASGLMVPVLAVMAGRRRWWAVVAGSVLPGMLIVLVYALSGEFGVLRNAAGFWVVMEWRWMILPLAMLGGVVLAWRGSAVVLAVTMAAVFNVGAYGVLLDKLANKRVLRDGAQYRMANMIRASSFAHDVIFACSDEQILYYLTRSRMPTTIARTKIMSDDAFRELEFGRPISVEILFARIAAQRPAYIAGKLDSPCFGWFGEETMRQYRQIYNDGTSVLWQMRH